jgi:hypothetical protein
MSQLRQIGRGGIFFDSSALAARIKFAARSWQQETLRCPAPWNEEEFVDVALCLGLRSSSFIWGISGAALAEQTCHYIDNESDNHCAEQI